MKIIYTIFELQKSLQIPRQSGKTIGFVPTMGALHEGHISLVTRCAEENDICVVSIFVNPTQFNNKNDLLTYPRTLDIDLGILKKSKCDFVFVPEVNEMYPEPDMRKFDFENLDIVMEGAHRPGHFNGVAQIVSKLFEAVKPDQAYFGEKDFQQLAIIRNMVKQLNLNIKIIGCPIVREPNGLAMSSRNARLSEEERKKASLISQTLFKAKELKKEKKVEELKEWMITAINNESMLKVEYVDIVDGNSLQSISTWDETDFPMACVAVFCGEVRLIDNISL